MDKRLYGLFFCLLVLQGQAQVNNIPAPKNVKVVEDSVSDTGFWVTWEPVSKADSYKVVLSPPKIGAVGVGNGIADKFTVIEGLAPDTEYKVTIVPVKGNDEGTPAVVVQRTALPATSSLFVVSSAVTANSMVVGWTKVPNAQSYSLEIAPSTGVTGGGRGIYKTETNLLGLTPNTEYTITLRAINWVGLGAAATVRQLTKLLPPSNVRVVPETVSHNSLSVHWEPVVGANTYEVSVAPPDGVIGAGQGITDTYVILRNLKADTQYRVQVGATNGAGLSEYRQTISKTLSVCYAKGMDFAKDVFTITCPARCARNQEHVYGTREYTDDSYICASAVHDRRIDDNVGGEVVVKKRPGLPHYIGTGKNGVISQDYGTWHRSFVFGLQIPQNIRILPESISHNAFTIEWDAVSGADAYRISVQPDFGVVGDRAGIEDTKATLRGLKADTEYQVYLTATNTLETSEAATIKQYTSLSAPPKLHVLPNSVSHDRMNISWFPVPGASHYVIEVQAGPTTFKHDTKKTFSMIDGLQSGIRYTIGVRAANSVGLGDSASISQYTKLSTPENVEGESVNWHRMYVQWSTVSGASHYLVSTVPAGLRNASEITENPYIWVEDLSSDTMYDIRVQAVNAHERSRSATIRQKTALGQPRNLVVRNKTHNSLTLNWDKIKNADSYYITISSIDGKYGIDDEREVNRLFLTGLEGNTGYNIKVVGRNMIGDGKPTTIGVTTKITPPSYIDIRKSDRCPSQIEVSWEKIPEATGYFISVSPGNDVSGTGLVNKNQGIIGGLRSGIEYTIKVMTVIGADRGMNVTTTFATGLTSPNNVRITDVLPYRLCIEWDVVVNADYYKLTYQNSRTSLKNSVDMIQNTSICLSKLDPGTQYAIMLHAVRQSRLESGAKHLGSIPAKIIGFTQLEQPKGTRYQNMTNTTVQVLWNSVRFATHYDVLIYPADRVNGTGERKVPKALFTGLTEGQQYVVWVYAKIDENDAAKSRRAELKIVLGSEIPEDEEEIENNANEPQGPIGVTEKSDPNSKKEAESSPQSTWIIIVVIVICLAMLILFTVVPCCCDCIRSKPLLKYHGWCGCCSPCSDVGCCGCRGCCNANVGKQTDGHYDVAGGRPYTPNLGRRTPRTQSRQSCGVFH